MGFGVRYRYRYLPGTCIYLHLPVIYTYSTERASASHLSFKVPDQLLQYFGTAEDGDNIP